MAGTTNFGTRQAYALMDNGAKWFPPCRCEQRQNERGVGYAQPAMGGAEANASWLSDLLEKKSTVWAEAYAMLPSAGSMHGEGTRLGLAE